ncbi:DNA-binding protein [Streptomyces sp. CNQ-509]|uniref:helix-turn-helix domain-containing protein n=1 Tax=Streptomyces sp. CNQ-509 TaxID=444103 RepID=UPI00062E0755|nr:helix-turn-helix transcriptional regulator [Streptomyces sp. CNQ-509]AKH84098.1 DNA-binding protein [Streptomyces sp. CNQ-509]
MAQRPRELTPDRSARHLFGFEMRRCREHAGMSLEGLAEVVKYSRSHLARIEVAAYMPPPDLAAALDAAFGTDGIFQRLYALARHEVHPDKYRRRMELEAQARAIGEYAGVLVPGIVQTEDYARAVFRAQKPRATGDQIEEMVTARMGRQALLASDRPPEFSAVLDEAVLRRPVGGPGVMGEQLDRLHKLTHTETTVVQVLPFVHGEHALLGGSLALFTLERGTFVAYEESIGTGQLLEDPELVDARRRAYDLLRAYALSPKDSAELIQSIKETFST